MLGQSLSLISCALGASALLLPPSVAQHKGDGNSVLPFFALDTKSQVLELPCAQCNWVSMLDGPVRTVVSEEQNLVLNFSISDDGQGLLVNDHFLWPFEKLIEIENVLANMIIEQVPASTTKEQIRDHNYEGVPLTVTGSGLGEGEVIHADDEDLVQLTWQLLSIEHMPATVDVVQIQLLRTGRGELNILSIDTAGAPKPSHPQLPPPQPHKQPCDMPGPLCAFADFFGSTFGHSGKPCPGRKPSLDGEFPHVEHLPTHIRPHIGRPYPAEEPTHGWVPGQHKGRPHHGPYHGHHGHRHFTRRILAVLIPIMSGATLGFVVGGLGFLFGRFLGWMWFTVYRGGRRGYTAVAAEEGLVAEKDVPSAEDEQSPPRYEDAPAYEEAVKQ